MADPHPGVGLPTGLVMLLRAVLDRWLARREEWRRLGVQVNGATVADEVVADLEALANAEADELLTLEEAARRSGYTPDHLGVLVREGKLRNHGRKHAPRVRWSDVPRKPGLTPSAEAPIVAPADRRQIARSVLSTWERPDEA